MPEILKRLVDAAKSGDMQAIRTVIDRVIPPIKAIELPVGLGDFAGSLSHQGQQILHSMAQGVISPGQATQLLSALAAQAKIFEVDELGRRLSEIEKRMGPNVA